MVQQWVDGERMTADKANHLCVRKVTTSELNGTSLDKEEGDLFYDTDKDLLVGWVLGKPCYYGRDFAGIVRPWPGTSIPSGWLICDGATISRTTYADLYAVIGTTYGNGDGSTTFDLPDLTESHRFINCADEDDELGDTGGEATHTLTIAELPEHKHLTSNTAYPPGSGRRAGSQPPQVTPGTTSTSGSTGGGEAHNNLPAYIDMYFIIKT